jgi:microcystin-dependent protein
VSSPFLGQIIPIGFNFAPKQWAFCNGQLLPINQNQALFALLGTTFGGDGRVNFALPNLQGNTPLHMGSGFPLGAKGGEQNHILTTAEIPAHTHTLSGTNSNGAIANPNNAYLGAVNSMYGGATSLTTLDPGSVSNAGGSQPHLNMQPFLTLSFCIALTGIFPSQN